MGEHEDLSGNFAGGQVPREAHRAREAEPQAMAQPTCVDTQNVCAGVSGM